MKRTVEIYKISGTTFVREVINGKEKVHSSNKDRDLKTTLNGVIILPDPDETELNNFEIVLDELVNNFGATDPDSLHEALRANEYFKKGGGVGMYEENTAFVDMDAGNNETAVIGDRNKPFETAEGARLAIEEVVSQIPGITSFSRRLEFYRIYFLGNNKTFAIPKLPQCSITLESLGANNVFDFSSATEALIDPGGNWMYRIRFNNPKGAIKFHKNFSGDGTVNTQYSFFEVNTETIDVQDLQGTATHFHCQTLQLNTDTILVGDGYVFNVQYVNSDISSNVQADRLTYVSGGSNIKSLFRHCYGGALSNTMKVGIKSIVGHSGEPTNFAYRIAYSELHFRGIDNLQLTDPGTNFTTSLAVHYVWHNAKITNAYLIPISLQSSWTGSINEIVMVNGGRNFSQTQGSDGVAFNNLTIKLIRWSDDDPIRNTILLRNSYSGNNITLTNFIIERSYVTFATLFSDTLANWNLGTSSPMKWFGMVAIHMENDNPPFSQISTSEISKIDMYGNLYLGEDKYLPAPDFQVNSMESDSDLKYVPVTASRLLNNADKNKTLVIDAVGVVLTMPLEGMSRNFNVTITATTGNNGEVVAESGVSFDAPNGLLIAQNTTKSIGRIGNEYIVRP